VSVAELVDLSLSLGLCGAYFTFFFLMFREAWLVHCIRGSFA
jgi:hypothetical protein